MKSGMNNSSSATSRWGSMFETKTTVTPRKNGDDPDDLLLFGEIHERSEKERSNNLLQPISSDHDLLDYSVSDPNSGSNYPLYSAKKINGMELPIERGKNDYDCNSTISIFRDGNGSRISSFKEKSLFSNLLLPGEQPRIKAESSTQITNKSSRD
ncbi:uncharacterized protein LOC113361952 isoform X2 [Papaver somniferum]|nr:uncharacterized protein LOC113361952 isoform X2 [Papaver somniferum]